jgi:hypothetical protein
MLNAYRHSAGTHVPLVKKNRKNEKKSIFADLKKSVMSALGIMAGTGLASAIGTGLGLTVGIRLTHTANSFFF